MSMSSSSMNLVVSYNKAATPPNLRIQVPEDCLDKDQASLGRFLLFQIGDTDLFPLVVSFSVISNR